MYFSFLYLLITCVLYPEESLLGTLGKGSPWDKRERQSCSVLEYHEERIECHLQGTQYHWSHFSWRQTQWNYKQMLVCTHLPSGCYKDLPKGSRCFLGRVSSAGSLKGWSDWHPDTMAVKPPLKWSWACFTNRQRVTRRRRVTFGMPVWADFRFLPLHGKNKILCVNQIGSFCIPGGKSEHDLLPSPSMHRYPFELDKREEAGLGRESTVVCMQAGSTASRCLWDCPIIIK